MVLVHAWGLSGRMWDAQVVGLLEAGLRVVVPDRRGHGRSEVTSTGYDLDTLADDLAAVLDALDLHDAVLVGYSAGSQEVLRALTRHGCDRAAGVVLTAPITPCLLRRDDNPGGIDEADLEALRTSWTQDFGRWVDDGRAAYFGAGAVSPPTEQVTVQMLMDTPLPVILATHRTMTRADLRPDLASLSLPTMVVHGTLDASAPVEATGRPTAELAGRGILVPIEGAGHGLYASHPREYLEALLAAVARPG